MCAYSGASWLRNVVFEHVLLQFAVALAFWIMPRFLTDPDVTGVEKLSIWPPTESWFEEAYVPLPHLDACGEGLGRQSNKVNTHTHTLLCSTNLCPGDLLPPFCVSYIKGWRRSLACLLCCEGIRTLGIDLADVTDVFKAGT